MPDPNLIAAQQSAQAAWTAVTWSRASFYAAVCLGTLGIAVNGVLAWLAYDGPRRQRDADRELAQQSLAHEAGKIINLHLGGLNACKAVYLTADDVSRLCKEMSPDGVYELRDKRPNLEMNVRLIDYFLGKDIADATLVHVLMKTRDAAGNIIGALSLPGLQAGATPQTYTDIGRVVDHVLEQCAAERRKMEERIAQGSAFIDQLAAG